MNTVAPPTARPVRFGSPTAARHRAGSSTRPPIVTVGTYPPTRCGLATFTRNTRKGMLVTDPDRRIDVIRVSHQAAGEGPDAPEVIGRWTPETSPAAVAACCARAGTVLLQHEFGIFGGEHGDDVAEFVSELTVPLVTVFHTVLADPDPIRRAITETVARASRRVIVLSETGADRLRNGYRVDADRLTVVPHGAELDITRARTSVQEPPIVLTWGLLGPGKGIEHGIRAVANLTGRCRPVRYIVAGQTHPNVLANEGEAYRERLRDLARQLGVADLVTFDDGYRDDASLRALVRSADVVLLPYDDREQVTSGVLVEALAAAKPVVATAFPHAVEVVPDQAGIVVPHGDHVAMADALQALTTDGRLRRQHVLGSWALGLEHAWPRVGARYVEVLDAVADAAVPNRWK